MAIITDAFVAALKKVKADADNLSEAELAQLTSVVNTKVTEANAALTAEVGDLKADMQKIADALTEDVSKVLILDQRGRPNSYRLMKSPSTRSCRCSVLEKQIVRRTNRLIRVRRLRCLLSIFCVLAFPTSCCSASRCHS